jgi:YVTN family beta-propeller protein
LKPVANVTLPCTTGKEGQTRRSDPIFNALRDGIRVFALALSLAVALAWVPVSAQPASREAFITNQDGNTVSVVDVVTMKAVGEIAVAGNPAGVAMSGDGRFAYVAAPESKELYVIDAEKRQVVRQISVGRGPLGTAAHPTRPVVYVADWYAHKLFVVDPANGTITGEVDTGQSPSGVAVTPDGAFVLTADRDSNQVSIIDTATLQRVATVPTGDRPFGITIDGKGERAYTANVRSNDVTVIDLVARKAVGNVAVGRRPYAVALAGGKAFVSDQYAETVSVFDTGTLKPVATIEVDAYPEGIAATADGAAILVACWEDNTLVKIDVSSLSVVAKVDVGAGPRAFGLFLR